MQSDLPPDFEDFKQRVKDLLENNRRVHDGYQYTVPSPEFYPHQWLWDSCFHAMVLSHFDIEAARKELKSVVARQLDSGMLPHMNYWDPEAAFVHIDWGRNDTSTVTQPPIISCAVWKIYCKDKDKQFLREMFQPLLSFYTYLFRDRDTRNHNLIGLINPDESGEDNSPRFDAVLGLPPQHSKEKNFERRKILYEKNITCNFETHQCMRDFFWVKDVPFNAFLVYDLKCFASIADELNETKAKDFAEKKAQAVTEAMRERMYEDGMFWPIYGEDHKKIKVLSWHVFAPMYAYLLSADEADDLMENYYRKSEHFKSAYPIPTVAKSDPSYNPEGFWRGPTWIGINWFLYQGLKRYGYFKEAAELRRTCYELVNKHGFREYFHPDNGEGLGATNFTWGTLVLDMFSD